MNSQKVESFDQTFSKVCRGQGDGVPCTSLPAELAESINDACAGLGLPTVVPETWREGCASLWMSGGRRIAARYIDGSCDSAAAFEIRLRCHGAQISDRLNVYGALEGIVAGAVSVGAACTSGISKCAVYENGDEEYRVGLEIRVRNRI